MKYLERYMIEKLKLKPIGELSQSPNYVCGSCNLSGVDVIIDGQETGLFIADVDYVDWLEKKIEECESPDSTTRPACSWNMELNSSPAYFCTTTTPNPDIALHSIKL